MSTTCTARIDAQIRAPLTQDNPVGTIPASIDALIQFSSSEVTKRHYKVYNIAASGNQSLDLASALADGFGNSLTFTTLKAIVVRNRSGSATAACTVERPSSNGVPFVSAAGTVPCNPLFVWVNENGTTVTASTGDLITINNADANAAADIEVLLLGT